MKYKYTAMNSKNQKKEGTIDASSQTEAIASLRSKGLIVQDIVETGAPTESIWDMDIGGDIHTRKIKPKKLLMFFNQMGMMMRAGINLSMSMDIMIQTEKDSGMKKILQEINENLYSGFTLSQAMRNFAGFPGVYLSIIEAGEANGRIDEAFEQSALICKKSMALASKIKSAMMYPIFLVVLVIGVIIIFTVFVIPNFAGVYEGFGAELPAITKILLDFSNFLINYWFITLVIVGYPGNSGSHRIRIYYAQKEQCTVCHAGCRVSFENTARWSHYPSKLPCTFLPSDVNAYRGRYPYSQSNGSCKRCRT